MTVALRSPHLLRALVPVDNAPVDVSLSAEFPKYVQAMKEIDEVQPRKQAEADEILEKYEKVCQLTLQSSKRLLTLSIARANPTVPSDKPCALSGDQGSSIEDSNRHLGWSSQ